MGHSLHDGGGCEGPERRRGRWEAVSGAARGARRERSRKGRAGQGRAAPPRPAPPRPGRTAGASWSAHQPGLPRHSPGRGTCRATLHKERCASVAERPGPSAPGARLPGGVVKRGAWRQPALRPGRGMRRPERVRAALHRYRVPAGPRCWGLRVPKGAVALGGARGARHCGGAPSSRGEGPARPLRCPRSRPAPEGPAGAGSGRGSAGAGAGTASRPEERLWLGARRSGCLSCCRIPQPCGTFIGQGFNDIGPFSLGGEG